MFIYAKLSLKHMGYSDMLIKTSADKLFKANDSRCIELYISLKNDYARSKLALIYLEGKCGQTKNVEKALYYSQNNSQYLANAIEAYILLFIKGCSDTEGHSYYHMLSELHEVTPKHPMVNKVLSTMYLQGKIVNMDFSTAVKINPRLVEQKMFNEAMGITPPEMLPTLLTHIKSFKNPAWSTLINKYCIEFYKNENKHYKASNLSIKWFSEEKNEESAYYILKYGLKNLNDTDYFLACEILMNSINMDRNLKCILRSAREREDWGRIEIIMSSECSIPAKFDYDRGRFEEHKGNINLACEYYLKSVYLNPKTEQYSSDTFDAIARAFKLKPELIIENRKYAEILLLKRKPQYTFIVADALYKTDIESNKKEAIKLLKQICNSHYHAAERMYELTGEQNYAKLARILKPTGDRTSDYHFDRRDSTEKIEANYQSLPPVFKIRALCELAKRYCSGKHNLKKDYEKSKDLVL